MTADAGTPTAELAEFVVDVTGNSGLYTTSFDMEFYIGQFPILIIDMDHNHNSGTLMASAIQDLEVEFDIEIPPERTHAVPICIQTRLSRPEAGKTVLAEISQGKL